MHEAKLQFCFPPYIFIQVLFKILCARGKHFSLILKMAPPWQKLLRDSRTSFLSVVKFIS